jgi:hypothetical protein
MLPKQKSEKSVAKDWSNGQRSVRKLVLLARRESLQIQKRPAKTPF